jgi:RNA 2',3'-cyclic 3'-phosphodiesterase
MTTASPENLRLFYALWPDQATRSALMCLQSGVVGRPIPPGNLHLTLAFLGMQSSALLPQLEHILSQLASPAFELVLDRLGYFPKHKILWAGMQQVPEPLETLQQALIAALLQHRICFDQQSRFKPHITLARAAQLPTDSACTPIIWRTDHIALVQSTTLADGPHYRVLASRRLKG